MAKRIIIIKKIKKRSGKIVAFSAAKIKKAIGAGFKASGDYNLEAIEKVTNRVFDELEERFNSKLVPEVEQVQDLIEFILEDEGFDKAHDAFRLYRELHRRERDISSLVDSDELTEKYLDKNDWRVKENANMTYSLQGLNNHVASIISANFWMNRLYSREARKAHLSGDLHIHDLSSLSAYCSGWDLKDLLIRGFGGVPGKVNSGPPKHLSAALGQLVNFFYTLQGEVAGAVAVSNFDTYMAPFIRYDKLTYKQVKQLMQEFVYNMNVPTRVGFQCMSDDTQILAVDGWKKYDEVEVGDKIRTFNIETGKVENKKIKKLFKKKYKGVMYNLKNRISDQFISPKHRVVRKMFNSDKYSLEAVEDVMKLKSPFIVPVAGNNANKDVTISDEQIKLMAWTITEGTIERPGKHRCCYRVSIYQSKEVNRSNYDEIKSLLDYYKLKYSEYEQHGLGKPVMRFRLDASSSRLIHGWFSKYNVKFVPEVLINMSERQSKLFLKTYLKADGFDGCKIATSFFDLVDDLQQIVCNAGWGSTVLVRKPTIGKKDIYVVRLIRHKETYIQKVSKVDYEGVIWCPNTDNETVIARRNGKVFITGNTPFTNVTMDLVPSGMVADEAVIIGGKSINSKYKEYQKEIDIFNKAFAEVMMAGDFQGRVFTFPIPTYSITKDFDWDKPSLEPIWEMTRKYGIPYFSNYINSDMSPDDARSMCCRLRIDNRVLRKRGGIFAANPLTGSIGVVTINLPRLGYLCAKEKGKASEKAKKEFFKRLGELMDVAKDSLITKRERVEKFTETGLYPYCRHYLSEVHKRNGVYWKNHFNTIGINGMHEALLNLMDRGIETREGKEFALDVMDYMREKLLIFQRETGELFNLEATPAEGTSHRFARIDKQRYPDIKTAADGKLSGDKWAAFYTNSTHLPVDFSRDIFEALDNQDEFQCKYSGGTVFHGFLGEALPDTKVTKALVRKVAENYKLPYFSITPTFSVCPKHGYIAGEYFYCPKCDEEIGYKPAVAG